MEQWPSVSVVIPARNAETTIKEALDSVLAQKYSGVLEVIVGDGSEDNATSELIRGEYPQVKVVRNPERITSAGLNRAIESSCGEVIVRCDAHAVLPPGYIEQAVRALRRTGAANVGGFQIPVGEDALVRAISLAMTTPLGAGDSRYKIGGREGPTDMVYLGVFRRRALEDVGGFDETIIHNQDYELNWRLRSAGEVVWLDPALGVTYHPRSSLRALSKQYFNYGRSKSVVLMRHPLSVRWRQLAPPALAIGLLVSALLGFAGSWGAAFILPLTYLAALVFGAVVVGVKKREAAATLLPLVLATMHLSWGIGFFLPKRSSVMSEGPPWLRPRE